MAAFFRHGSLRILGLLVLAWPLLVYGQGVGQGLGRLAEAEIEPEEELAVDTETQGQDEAADAAGAETTAGPSVYETLVFDSPVSLALTADLALEPDSTLPMNLQPETALAEQRLLSMQAIQDAISAIELEGGPWELGLTENLAAMAQVFEQQGAYQEAADAYARAMHISRVNLGLDSLDHLPVVERMIDVYLALGDLASADQYQEYLYYTQRRAFGLEDPRMVPVLNRMARWKLRMFNAGFGEPLVLNLVSALRLYQTTTNLVISHFGRDDERYARLLRDTAGTAYLVSRYRSQIEDMAPTDYRGLQEQYPDPNGHYRLAFVEGYEDGLEALQLIADSFPEDQRSSRSYAEALIHQADWFLLFDRHRSAQTYYAQAYDVLLGLEDGAQVIEEVFARVTPLPDFSEDIESIFVKSNVAGRSQVARSSGFVDVMFDVTPYGSVVNLEILSEEAGAEDARVFSTLRRQVRATTFRPVISQGQTVRSEGNRFRYPYVY
jgi:tetratricopeptide (TPR) repeat protein